MPEKFIHGIDYKELTIAANNSLSPLQSHILKTILPDSKNWKEFLNPDIKYLPSPFLLPDLTASIQLINRHIENKSHILLFGDRDTDGISSTTQLGIFFRTVHEANGGKLTVKTSSANDDYGLCPNVLTFIKSANPNLLITLDFGTSNYEEINELASLGIDVIVLDHHEIPVKIPKCKLINPKREDSIYPEKKICTSTLAMKLIFAFELDQIFKKEGLPSDTLFPDLESIYRNKNIEDYFEKYPTLIEKLKSLLDLSSIGTITDMMPLFGENRIVVRNGIESLSKVLKTKPSNRKGLYSLMSSIKINPEKITSKDLGWGIGPALNAAGRMGKTEVAVKLLFANEEKEAEIATRDLLQLNTERKERTKRNLYKVEEYFKRKPERTKEKIIFCYEPDMEPGVSGIVATKLVETYKRPAIFITPDHGHGRGSIRSYQSENVLDLLNLVSDLLIHFGGHKEAGGFSIELKNIPLLEQKLKTVANEWLTNQEDIITEEQSIVSFQPSDITEKIFNDLQIFQPFGQENPEPLLSIKGAKIISFKPMSDGQHARFQVLGASPKIKFIIWNRASEFENFISKNSTVDLFGILEENFYNNSTTIQFVVSEFQS
ncbi:MAG TPA: single-stranded-DNA-specific exonuclease RecJ [Leptospiraceae bacterium]|nr:single-stranded-DNA-specific exonuclease RecJ [Leptospiraceae bacterium]HMW07266.1 single-stranded-DNA-specific exonuclease RecJ [Leptospiraceae bacterium]HMX34219.1 single-stranded-DNA-specific exonuclease RecJ [Leptospiraceae bacterium]HMY32916.1 single-stranded-DNA-specific exonuclease RecJ [Leptospiraceae bacterium]HMZ66071.1 single-stranded-DNA-specific exonuclease RecJ [Leptospiraceae bacterium]